MVPKSANTFPEIPLPTRFWLGSTKERHYQRLNSSRRGVIMAFPSPLCEEISSVVIASSLWFQLCLAAPAMVMVTLPPLYYFHSTRSGFPSCSSLGCLTTSFFFFFKFIYSFWEREREREREREQAGEEQRKKEREGPKQACQHGAWLSSRANPRTVRSWLEWKQWDA